jgi:hypothetical protein
MKVPYSWIKEFIDIDIPVSDVVAKLNTTGIETTFINSDSTFQI